MKALAEHMKSEQNNPPSNQLGAGITEHQVSEAIRKSGYPLQTIISSGLRKQFRVIEEWSYIDSDTKTLRAMDIMASRRMFHFQYETQPLVRPILNLLVECKQSDLPFIFFVSATYPEVPQFPLIAGLPHEFIKIASDDDRSVSSWNWRVTACMGLDGHHFLKGDIMFCSSFSKCVRAASKSVELSGTEAFQSTVLPMLKALKHFKAQEAPSNKGGYFDCHVTLPVIVIDAPMIAVRVNNDENSLSLTPWVRVIKNEAVEAQHEHDRTQTYAIDFVHRSFFDEYLQEHATPFAQAFADAVLRHPTELASGEAFVSGMKTVIKDPAELEKRFRPRPPL